MNLKRFTNGLHHLANTPLVPGSKSWQEAGLDDMEAMGFASDNDDDDDDDVNNTAASQRQKAKPKSFLYSWLVFITRVLSAFVLVFVLVIAFQIQQKNAATSLTDSPYYQNMVDLSSKAMNSILSLF